MYLKNFGEDIDDEKLRTMCEVHGVVTSVKVMFDDKSGRGKGFGFVSFEDHSAAQKVWYLELVSYKHLNQILNCPTETLVRSIDGLPLDGMVFRVGLL